VGATELATGQVGRAHLVEVATAACIAVHGDLGWGKASVPAAGCAVVLRVAAWLLLTKVELHSSEFTDARQAPSVLTAHQPPPSSP
jgi:hypothetical protein